MGSHSPNGLSILFLSSHSTAHNLLIYSYMPVHGHVSTQKQLTPQGTPAEICEELNKKLKLVAELASNHANLSMSQF
jgi:hypothetical protein